MMKVNGLMKDQEKIQMVRVEPTVYHYGLSRGQAYRGMRHDREDIHTPKNIDTIYPRSRKALFALVFSFNLALWEGVS